VSSPDPTAGLRIDPCGPEDLGFLYALAATVTQRWYRLCRRGLPPPHEFEEALWQGVTCQFVTRSPDGTAIAVSSLHDLDLRNGIGWIDVVGDDDLHIDAVGPTTLHLLDHAFGNWPLRKLYATHLDLQPSPFSAAGVPFDVEARLREFAWHDGMYWDRVITAVRRTQWTEHQAASQAGRR